MSDLAAIQRELLAQREVILKDLGLDSNLEDQRRLASRAPPNRGAKRKREEPRRVSSRVRGVAAAKPIDAALSLRLPRRTLGESRMAQIRSRNEAAASAAVGVQEVLDESGGALDHRSLIKATVKEDTTIRAFVEGALGVGRYIPGRGYHEFKEGLKVNVYTTDFICEGPDGKTYRGVDARRASGVLSVSKGQKDAPALPSGWSLFLKSRSYTRKLKAGQRFIYEK